MGEPRDQEDAEGGHGRGEAPPEQADPERQAPPRIDHAEGEAREAIRGLIEKIVATPVPTKGKRMSLDLTLHGDLAGTLLLSLNADKLS